MEGLTICHGMNDRAFTPYTPPSSPHERAVETLMPTKLLCSEIPLTDSATLDAMTEAMPDGAELRGRLRRGYRGIAHRYYAETRTAFTIVADGTTAQCFEIVGLTPEQAKRIAEACDEIEEWSVETFRAIVEEALGRQSDRLQ
jgi:hypothetical protein